MPSLSSKPTVNTSVKSITLFDRKSDDTLTHKSTIPLVFPRVQRVSRAAATVLFLVPTVLTLILSLVLLPRTTSCNFVTSCSERFSR